MGQQNEGSEERGCPQHTGCDIPPGMTSGSWLHHGRVVHLGGAGFSALPLST